MQQPPATRWRGCRAAGGRRGSAGKQSVPVALPLREGHRAGLTGRRPRGQSLSEAFEPAKAFALAQRLEIHHTPTHGSWLNIAEVELSALTRRCLDRRIDNLDTLNAELAAWQWQTNAQRQVDWQFTTADARIKLRHLYPNY